MAKKSADLNSYDIDAIDKKFEKLNKETIAKMTGTGSDRSKKKKAATPTKKVKRK